jgi:hypothetical protein
MAMTLKERQIAFLDEMITFYSEDPLRRAKTDSGCEYQTIDGRKCAIGRHLLYYDQNMEDRGVDDLVHSFPNCLPKEILDLSVPFLKECQGFHDNGRWDDKEDIQQRRESIVTKL